MVQSDRIHISTKLTFEEQEFLLGWLKASPFSDKVHHFLTSGSTAGSLFHSKWVILSDDAIQNAAQASNEFLDCTKSDKWLNPLPSFHVGGFSIFERARLLGNEVVGFDWERWNPRAYAELLEASSATLSSLVPTQVFDLVQAHLRAPESVRAIIVGGARLPDDLYWTARELGWPLLRSYGLTEACSQVATEKLSSLDHQFGGQELKLLPHLDSVTDSEGRIMIRGSSLFSGYLLFQEGIGPYFYDPKTIDRYFITEDYGRINGRSIEVTGRTTDQIKINGELISLNKLREKLSMVAGQFANQLTLLEVDDKRRGNAIVMVFESNMDLLLANDIQNRYNSVVLPLERIRDVIRVENLPRTALNKIKWEELRQLVKMQTSC